MKTRTLLRTILALCALCAPLCAQKLPSVGMPARLNAVVLPGSELEVDAADPRSALVLRITRTSPHGSAFRYDFEYFGLEPGKYDLRDALRRRDGTPIARLEESPADPHALPAVAVEVTSVLAPGIVKPHVPPAAPLPSLGGYAKTLIALGVVWLIGLGVIVFGWRKRRLQHAAATHKPRTLAERLRPLVESALEGRLSREQRAQLELGLVAFWRRKLGLEEQPPAQMLVQLREHAQAGPLLSSLEAWLHMPAPPEKVDLQALLAPYRDLPADAIPEFQPSAPLAR
jgi:hypothetical protein